MRLPRNLKMFRGPADASALAGTLFLLWMVTMLHSSIVLPPGMRLQLPDATALWGEVVPQIAVAIDPNGRVLFENQVVAESNLLAHLRERVATGPTNPTVLLLADRSVPLAMVTRLATLVRSAGVRDVVLATSPRSGPVAELPSKAP